MKDGATRRELDQLSRFAASLGATMDVDVLVEDALEPLMSMSGAERAMIALAQNDSRLLIPATTGWPGDAAARGIPSPAVAALGTEAVAFERIESLPSALASRFEPLEGRVAVVPLWAQAHLRGVIVLHRATGTFNAHMLKMLTTAGRQLALAVENSRLLTDLQDSYRKLMDTQEDLIRAERLAALGQLSATMAHEIRNPLATIFSAISQIRKLGVEQEMSRTLLDIAEEEASRLNRMVAQLLKFARPRKPDLHAENLLDTVRKAAETFLSNRPLKDSISLVTDVGDIQDLTIPHDGDQVEQAILLALENAADAMEEHDGEIRVAVAPFRTGAVIRISDTGVGIPMELQSKVFEPFFSTRPTGTGLGLPTIKRVVEDHRGTLELESNPGTGTTLHLFLQTKLRTVG